MFTWLNMMFAAGMGVGLLFYGVAEPILHYEFISKYTKPNVAMGQALTLTIFHWGLHAWAFYGVGGLVIAYFWICGTDACALYKDAPTWKRQVSL